MKKFTAGLLLIFFFVTVVECQRWNNGKKSSKTGAYHSEETNGGKLPEPIHSAPKSQSVKHFPRSGGIGAWGYVSIILFVILSGLGVYYTIIFYPIVCKKQRMYHVMGSTTV